MPITRNKPRKKYKLISEFGFGLEDILDVLDATSGLCSVLGMFDHETTPDDDVEMLDAYFRGEQASKKEKKRLTKPIMENRGQFLKRA